MTYKIKVILGFMAIIALFSVLTLINSFRFGGPSLTNIKQSAWDIVDNDWDKDGLSNKEESYWNTDPNKPDTDGDGFLDGEEVSSGHDPLKPGPDDLLNNGNVTEKFSKLTLSGLYEGSLKPSNPDFTSSVNNLLANILEDANKDFQQNITGLNLPTIESSKNNQEIYLKSFSELFKRFTLAYFDEMNHFEKNLNIIGDAGFSDIGMVGYFNSKTSEFQSIFNDASGIYVPKNWQQSHLGFLKLAAELMEINKSLTFGSKDPIKAVIALNRLPDYMDVLPKLADTYLDIINKQKLNVKATVFEQ
ncbi:MAG: hypothetical protein WD989_02490 [Candidatus Paceibacterota bacterium]